MIYLLIISTQSIVNIATEVLYLDWFILARLTRKYIYVFPLLGLLRNHSARTDTYCILSRSHTHSQAQQLILEKSLNVKSALKHAFIFAVKHFTSQQIKQFIFS